MYVLHPNDNREHEEAPRINRELPELNKWIGNAISPSSPILGIGSTAFAYLGWIENAAEFIEEYIKSLVSKTYRPTDMMTVLVAHY